MLAGGMQQRGSVREVAVERPKRDSRRCRDVVHGDVVDGLGLQHGHHGVEHGVSQLLRLPLPKGSVHWHDTTMPEVA